MTILTDITADPDALSDREVAARLDWFLRDLSREHGEIDRRKVAVHLACRLLCGGETLNEALELFWEAVDGDPDDFEGVSDEAVKSFSEALHKQQPARPVYDPELGLMA